MTKLFSMKSLAFAGAAAFAVALAAAPQVDAADAEKLSLNVSDISKATVTTGKGSLTKTKDGTVIYYQVAKDKDKIKDGKYVAIADENLGYYNFSSLSGKAQYLSISPDGTKDSATGVAIKASPKLTAKLDAKDGLKLTIDKKDATILSSGSGITKVKTDDGEFEISGVDGDIIKSASVLGGTLEITAKQQGAADGIASASKVAKLKIAGKAKAPKVSLKLDATKKFTWKIAKKQEYIIETDAVKGHDWKDGSDSADDWATIAKNSSASLADVVSGDAITADITISLRTKADKKAASAINVIKLSKSAASPVTAASIKITKAEFSGDKVKKATSAAIAATGEIQYSTDGGEKWKKLSAGKEGKLKATETSVLVRTPGVSKNKFVLPSLNTTFTIDYNAGTAAATYLGYNGDKVGIVTPAQE